MSATIQELLFKMGFRVEIVGVDEKKVSMDVILNSPQPKWSTKSLVGRELQVPRIELIELLKKKQK